MFANVIIKISGEALQGVKAMNAGDDMLYPSYNDEMVESIVAEIIACKQAGVNVSMVIGGGNYWRGRSARGINRAKADQIGMLATIMNGVYLSESFRLRGAEVVVMTPFTVGTFTRPFEVAKAVRLMESGAILIFAGGSGLPFFSTDTIAAVRGAELSVDAVLFAKNVDGVYDADPKEHPGAKRFDRLTYDEVIKRDLRVIDIAAMEICKEYGLKSIVFGLFERNGITNAVLRSDKNYQTGTIITR
ncbi:MAG: UMP kinase [Clostridiales bacterium]|jgi:uridylate kinase|nr:UMP kinase [Clostridiales bacterium]